MKKTPKKIDFTVAILALSFDFAAIVALQNFKLPNFTTLSSSSLLLVFSFQLPPSS